MFRRKLVLNIVIVLICGLIAISLPVIVNHMSRTAHANNQPNTEDWQLVSINVGDQYCDLLDTTLIWQLECRKGKQVVHNWQQIYHVISTTSSTITYNQKLFRLTSYGLVRLNNKTTEHYSVVIYQNHQCRIDLN